MIYKGLVITGTDTGVGKTAVACALVRLFRESGFSVGVLKPVETGCEGEGLVPADGMMLAEAAGISLEKSEYPIATKVARTSVESPVSGEAPTSGENRTSGEEESGEREDRVAKLLPLAEVTLDDIVPWRFGPALAPEEAARLGGIEISVDRIFQAVDRWMGRADLILVETAGGIMVPLNQRFAFVDLMVAMEMPVVIVAPNRLGVINQTLLTIEALLSRRLTPLAVVLCQLSPDPGPSAPSNADAIGRHGGVPVFEVPYAGGESDGNSPAAAAVLSLRPHLETLQRAMESEWKRTALGYVNSKKTRKRDLE